MNALADLPHLTRAAARPLRFAMVTTFYPPYNFGGDGIYVQRLARALAARGHHVEVIHDTDAYRSLSGTDPGTPGSPDSSDGITVHRLRSALPTLAALRVQQFGQPGAHRAEIARTLGDRFDVIHYHNVSLVGGPGVWALGAGVKLHTAHEHWLVCPSHILWRDNREVCDERHCIRCVINHRRPPQLWRATGLMARAARHVDAFLMLSASAADNHRRFGFAAPMTVVPSFLPDAAPLPPADAAPLPPAAPDVPAAAAADPAGTRPYFLFVGRLETIKGLQDVIPHFTADLAADLLIAGTGDFEPELRRLAAGRPSVRFLGRLGMEALRGLYRDARAVLTPSRCLEVFPLVVLEAFREATPIVARDLGPYPEIVQASGGGLLFHDAASLGAALQRLTRAPQEARAMGRLAQAAYLRHWTEEVAMAAYFQVIGAVARRKGNPALAETCAAWGVAAG